jgi:3-oxoacyl-[acyl-carrier-protein] synthase II
VLVPSAACASGTAAIGLALDLVRDERAEVVLCGGFDGLTDFVAQGFASLQALDRRGPARPFDHDRAGLSLGEGAAFLVVESDRHAARRGGRGRARLRGFGLSGDAVHMTGPDREGRGAARAITDALTSADVAGRAVDFVSAHGTGTAYNDAMEARAFTAAGVALAPVHGLKGAIGHSLGAAGAFEAILCVRALERGRLPPTTGLVEVDPDLGLDVVREERRGRFQIALSTSSGFGGINAAIVLERVGGA